MAQSAEPPAGIHLPQAVDAAWARAVAAREASGLQQRAQAEQAVAASLLAGSPSLTLSHRDDRLHDNIGKRESEIGMALPLWLPGQRKAQGLSAQAALAQAEASTRAARWRLAAEVYEAAWQLHQAQAQQRYAEDFARSQQALAQDVERRVKAGELAPADALAAQAEYLAAAADATESTQQTASARSRWALLTGQTALPLLPVPPAAPQQPVAESPPDDHALQNHPERQWAQATTALAQQQLAQVQQSRRDAPELSVSLRQDLADRNAPAQGSLNIGLRLPFDTAQRNRPLEAAALSALDLAQTHEARLLERLHSTLADARTALTSAQLQADAAAQRAHLLQQRATLLERSFQAGESALPELLRARQAAAEAASQAARATFNLSLAHARLAHASGQLP